MTVRSGQQIHDEAGNADIDDDIHRPSVGQLRRQREQTFREVGFSTLAEQAVNGFSTIQYPVVDDSSPDYLLTPLIDMSLFTGSGSSGENDLEEKPPRHSPTLLPPFFVLRLFEGLSIGLSIPPLAYHLSDR